MARIQQRRGLKANLPATGLLAGELYLTTDTNEIFMAIDATTMAKVVPDVGGLATIPAITGAEDLLSIYDSSEATGAKLKKITFNDFKSALNIPEASTDEMVAVVSGGVAGYIWGTDGTNGIIRANPAITITKDVGNAFITLDVGTIDCGTF